MLTCRVNTLPRVIVRWESGVLILDSNEPESHMSCYGLLKLRRKKKDLIYYLPLSKLKMSMQYFSGFEHMSFSKK